VGDVSAVCVVQRTGNYRRLRMALPTKLGPADTADSVASGTCASRYTLVLAETSAFWFPDTEAAWSVLGHDLGPRWMDLSEVCLP